MLNDGNWMYPVIVEKSEKCTFRTIVLLYGNGNGDKLERDFNSILTPSGCWLI